MKRLTATTFAMTLLVGTSAYATPFLTHIDNTPGVLSETLDSTEIDGLKASDSITVFNRSGDYDQWATVPKVYNGYEFDGDAETDPDYSGFYIGTFSGNDNKVLLGLIDYYLSDVASDYVIKYNVPDALEDPSGISTDNDVTLTVDVEDDGLSGDWSLSSSVPGKEVVASFYSVKGADEFALYYLDPAFAAGAWSTIHLLNGGGNVPELSHFTVVAAPAPVPEPATMLLFGTGIAGLASLRRKRSR